MKFAADRVATTDAAAATSDGKLSGMVLNGVTISDISWKAGDTGVDVAKTVANGINAQDGTGLLKLIAQRTPEQQASLLEVEVAVFGIEEAGIAIDGQPVDRLDPALNARLHALYMRAGDRQHMATLQDMFGQPLGAAGVGRAGIEDGFHQRELGFPVRKAGARDDVAHHENVRLLVQLVA